MKDYICELCSYTTKVKQYFKVHCETNKHIANLKESLKCECAYCGKIFGEKRYLNRHVKICTKKIIEVKEINNINVEDAKDVEIKYLKLQIEYQKIEKEQERERYRLEKEQHLMEKNQYSIIMETQINFLKIELNKLHNVIENNGKLADSAMSTLNYAIKHHNTAPELMCFNNFALLKIYDTLPLLDTVMYMQKKKLLHEYINQLT